MFVRAGALCLLYQAAVYFKSLLSIQLTALGVYLPFLMIFVAVSSREKAAGGGVVVVGMKRAREEAEREAEEGGEREDPYGGSTDEAEDMEVDVGT